MPEWVRTYIFMLAMFLGSAVLWFAYVLLTYQLGEGAGLLVWLGILVLAVTPLFCWYMEP